MSDRERWIVYPLLLLAIGMAMRTKAFVKTEHVDVNQLLDAEQITCRRLVLTNDKGEPLLGLGPDNNGTYGVIQAEKGALNINGPVLAKQMRCEEMAIVGGQGERVMTLTSQYIKNADGKHQLRGGHLVLFNDKLKPRVVLGESPAGGTVAAVDDAGKEVIIGHVQRNDKARLAGMFTIEQGGKLKPLGSRFDQTAAPQPKDDAVEPDNPKEETKPAE